MITVAVDVFDKDGIGCGSRVFETTEDFDLKKYPVVCGSRGKYFELSIWNAEKKRWDYVCGEDGKPDKKDLSLLNLKKIF